MCWKNLGFMCPNIQSRPWWNYLTFRVYSSINNKEIITAVKATAAAWTSLYLLNAGVGIDQNNRKMKYWLQSILQKKNNNTIDTVQIHKIWNNTTLIKTLHVQQLKVCSNSFYRKCRARQLIHTNVWWKSRIDNINNWNYCF